MIPPSGLAESRRAGLKELADCERCARETRASSRQAEPAADYFPWSRGPVPAPAPAPGPEPPVGGGERKAGNEKRGTKSRARERARARARCVIIPTHASTFLAAFNSRRQCPRPA